MCHLNISPSNNIMWWSLSGPAGVSGSLHVLRVPVWLSVNKDTYVRLTGVSKLVAGVNECVNVSLCKYGGLSTVRPTSHLKVSWGRLWKTDGWHRCTRTWTAVQFQTWTLTERLITYYIYIRAAQIYERHSFLIKYSDFLMNWRKRKQP